MVLAAQTSAASASASASCASSCSCIRSSTCSRCRSSAQNFVQLCSACPCSCPSS